jgi:hypothetical protein
MPSLSWGGIVTPGPESLAFVVRISQASSARGGKVRSSCLLADRESLWCAMSRKAIVIVME